MSLCDLSCSYLGIFGAGIFQAIPVIHHTDVLIHCFSYGVLLQLVVPLRDYSLTHSLTHSYFLSGDNQPTVAFVDIHLQSVIYCWTVLICRMPAENTSLLPASEICLKLSTIVLLLILSKPSIFIAYYSISFYVFHSF